MSGCRIGTVRLKSGCEVRRLRAVDRLVNREAEQMIADALDDVRNGEVRALGLVLVKRSGFVSTGFSNSPEGSFHALNSGAALLAARLSSQED